MVALVGSHRSFIHVETFFSTRRRRGSRNRAERKPDFIIWDTTPPPPPPPPCIASHHDGLVSMQQVLELVRQRPPVQGT